MKRFPSKHRSLAAAAAAIAILLSACTSVTSPYSTRRDKTAKGAGIGAIAGAAAAILDGKEEADEILAGAAIGAVVGGGIGAYMDAQEEKFARIPGTTTERVGPDTLLVRFDSDVLFEIDSAALCPTCRDSLEESAWVLNQYPKTAVVVQGHTDSTGTEEHNQALSERRAGAVGAFLVGRGIAPARIATVGYGEGYPVAGNDSPAGRRLNRRVDLMLRAKAR